MAVIWAAALKVSAYTKSQSTIRPSLAAHGAQDVMHTSCSTPWIEKERFWLAALFVVVRHT